MTLLEYLKQHIFVPMEGARNTLFILGTLVVAAFLLFVISAVPPSGRRRLIAAVTFIAGAFYVLEFFLPAYAKYQIEGREFSGNPLSPWVGPVGAGLQIIGTFAVGLGVVNLFMIHGRNIAKQRGSWGNSLALLIAMFVMFIVGIWQKYWPGFPSEQKFVFPQSGAQYTLVESLWEVLFKGVYVPLDATMFALLAFFITSAAFRAFRIRSLEATLLMIAAFLVVFGLVPIGQWATSGLPTEGFWSSLRSERIMDWIMTIMNTSARRGILIGYTVGQIAMALRVWLNLEKGSYFEST